MHLHQSGRHSDDLVARVTQEATHALLDHEPQSELKAMAHYDVLLVAFRGWRLRSLLNLTASAPVVAKDPFAWLLFQHPVEGWWAAYEAHSACLSHPFSGTYLHTHLVTPGGLTVGETRERFLEAVYLRATQPRYVAGGLEDPSSRDVIHAQWVLGHFPSSEEAAAYAMLLGLGGT